MFKKILIANRGEIACRVARTCHRLGISSVAVFSDADASALHVSLCDEAYRIGPSAARDSYLRSDLMIQAAQQCGAQAIHPGYGFLSENADFAAACEQAGIVFIGPPAAAIRAMGSKSAAKTIMEKAQVPILPGFHGEAQDESTLYDAAKQIGYPLLIKASSGGGGKGMRIVESAQAFVKALAGAKREALGAFGDDTMIIEKYLTQPRHIEMQIFADRHDNTVHLFERDCSIQRRYQKILEEAPAPGISETLRREMADAAIAAVRAINYVGAGTVEFIVQEDRFYFMEMNTRLQVEHPVTEMISGQDLVAWQIRVAAGEPLPLSQEQLTLNGHAIEVRVYAERPQKGFLPATGRIIHLRTPALTAQVRIDSGVREGDEIGIYYDPMLAKLIVHGADRASALRFLQKALASYQIDGVDTNLDFLRQLAAHPAYVSARLSTAFIETYRADLLPAAAPANAELLALAALGELHYENAIQTENSQGSDDPWSPWLDNSGWRLNGESRRQFRFEQEDRHTEVWVKTLRQSGQSDTYQIQIGENIFSACNITLQDSVIRAQINDAVMTASVTRQNHNLIIYFRGKRYQMACPDLLQVDLSSTATLGSLNAPMPGSISKVFVDSGNQVKQGDTLMILEAMKMEHNIVAPQDGVVLSIHYAPGDQVTEGSELLTLGPAEQ